MTEHPKTLSPMRRRAVDKLLIQFLELPEREQPAWLERTRKRLPRLGRWLELLTDDSHTITLLDDSVRRLAGESVERMEANTRQLNPGDRLGPWKIMAEVGRGGMGRVYRGQRADGAFEMDVAIKLIGRRQRGLAELLQRECRLLARLDHPSVTRLVDAGLDDQAGPFLVMEWVDGMDLADWLEQENPDLETRLNLFERITEAVAHAHQRLIVHGDIKPNNIRIRDDGSVKLMDFGVARLLNSDDSEDAGLRALTPAFAAPEQKAGEETTPASDIWSLGAVLAWLMTGQILDRSTEHSAASLKASQLPRNHELTAIIQTACADTPELRYASTGDLLADFKRYRLDQPLSCMTTSAPARALKFARRNALLVGATMMLALAILTGLGVSTALYLQAERERAIAERSETTARTVMDLQQEMMSDMDPATLADGLVHGLRLAIREHDLSEAHLRAFNELIDAASPIDIMREQLVDLVLDPVQARFDQLLGQDPQTDGALQHSLAEVYFRWGLFDQALERFQLAHAARLQAFGPVHPDTLASLRHKAVTKRHLGNTARSLEMLKEAKALGLSALPEHHPEILKISNQLGGTLNHSGRHQDAVTLLERTVELAIRELGDESPEAMSYAENLAVAHHRLGNLEAAREILEHSLETRQSTLGENHRRSLATTNNLAILNHHAGSIDTAVEMFRLTVDIAMATWGRNHPATLFYKHNYAQALVEANELEAALAMHKRAYEGRRELLGNDHNYTLNSSVSIANTLYRLQRHEEAVARIQETYRRLENQHGPEHIHTLDARRQLGHMMVNTGQLDSGLAHLGEAHQDTQRLLGPTHELTLNALGNRLRAMVNQGLYEQAHELVLSDPAFTVQSENVGMVLHYRFLYRIIIDLYEDWHEADPYPEHKAMAEYWRQRLAELE